MTPRYRLNVARRAWPRRLRSRQPLAWGAAVVALALTALFALAPPPPPTAAEVLRAYVTSHAQTITVSQQVAVAAVSRDSYTATPAIETFTRSGTNYDWAKLVLSTGRWPMSDANVTVLTRWMRQENGADDWWNRNNPLNNGWGSGGGGGTGTYPNLVVAAKMAADALHSNPGYHGIVAALADSASTKVTEHAIWASPWASGHYANGGHWAYTPVDVVKAPQSAW
jgi:hypothetical protein